MTYKFEVVPRRQGQTMAKKPPYILVSQARITLSQEVYKSLGDPDFLMVEIDTASYAALRLSRVGGGESTARRVLKEDRTSTKPYINFRASQLVRGWYKPLGGGVFTIDKIKERKKP